MLNNSTVKIFFPCDGNLGLSLNSFTCITYSYVNYINSCCTISSIYLSYNWKQISLYSLHQFPSPDSHTLEIQIWSHFLCVCLLKYNWPTAVLVTPHDIVTRCFIYHKNDYQNLISSVIIQKYYVIIDYISHSVYFIPHD